MEQVARVWRFMIICFINMWTFVRGRYMHWKMGSPMSNEDILQWHEEQVRKIQGFMKGEVWNKTQCIDLCNKLDHIVHVIRNMITFDGSLKFGSMFEELCCIMAKISLLIENCGTKIGDLNWFHAIVFQLESREAFRELVLDLKCCYEVAWDIFSASHDVHQEEYDNHIEFDAATFKDVMLDREDCMRRLSSITDVTSEDGKMARYLRERLMDLEQIEGGELDAYNVRNYFGRQEEVDLRLLVDEGTHGFVYKSLWMGLPCAKKILKEGTDEEVFHKEAGILAGLNHPNLINFVCCGNDEKNGRLYLKMERMERSLTKMLESQEEPMTYLVAIDVMHQIASGMCYLHDMQVAHRDLKPDNVLVSSRAYDAMGVTSCYLIVKLIDFGVSKIEVGSKLEIPNHYNYGTRHYTAPEVFNLDKAAKADKTCYFETDVFSFAMVCSRVISGQKPFLDTSIGREILQRLIAGNRPDLPSNCEELSMLIRECWALNSSKRPIFSDICRRLTNLKKKFLMGVYANETPQFGGLQNTVLNIQEGPIKAIKSPEKHEEIIGVKGKLLKVKDLLKTVKVLGLVGMGGIGKTTLAKEILKDMKSTYDVSCFVGEMKNKDCLLILWEILQEFKVKEKAKDLQDAQRMLKEFLIEKKVLLILDDINDNVQVCNIIRAAILPNEDTTLIVTTRNWSVIKDSVSESGKVEVDTLDEHVALKLFTSTYSFGGEEQVLPKQFREIGDEIVKACKGLPLSLKVMGAFLHGKERLRSWERALQRMKRGRCLDGNKDSSGGLWSTLRISFDDGLNDKEKSMFLDISCFFCRDVYPKGMLKERDLHILTDTNDGDVTHTLETLVDQSLVKVDKDGFWEMHDQLRDMGQMLAEKEYTGTRIWNANTILSKGFTSKDAMKVEGILYQSSESKLALDFELHESTLVFSSLRLLSFYSGTNKTSKIVKDLEKICSLARHCGKLRSLLIDISLSNDDNDDLDDATLTILPEALGNLMTLTILDLGGCLSWCNCHMRLVT